MDKNLPSFNFLHTGKLGGMDFNRYFDYLALPTTQAKLSSQLQAFFNPVERYDLNSKITLHDAWLLGFSLNSKFPKQYDTTDFKLELMQAFHEQEIILRYKNVSQYQMIAMSQTILGQPRDLLWHELTVLENGFRHLMEFDEYCYIEVIFSDFSFEYVDV